MKLHKLAIALAALSITGAAVAAGNDTSTSTTGAANDQPMSQQAAPSASDQSASPQAGSSQMGSPSSAAPSGSASNEQNNPELVRSAQQALKQKGFDAGAADGQMGPTTEGALRKFQQAQGLPQSGNLDQQTLAALGVNESESSMNQGSTGSPSSQSSQGSQSKGSTSSQGATNTSASYK